MYSQFIIFLYSHEKIIETAWNRYSSMLQSCRQKWGAQAVRQKNTVKQLSVSMRTRELSHTLSMHRIGEIRIVRRIQWVVLK